MVNDPIADFLSRIRNAIVREKTQITLPSSKMIEAMSKILKEEGFINGYSVEEKVPQNEITLDLKYVNGVAAIRNLERISKPGVRSYVGYKEIPRVKQGVGIAILSTPSGVLSGKEARKQKVGGEYICRVW